MNDPKNGKHPLMPSIDEIEERVKKLPLHVQAVNRLTKWKTVLAGWQLGTRPMNDPECAAVRDQRELLLCLRVELNALLKTLVDARIIQQSTFESNLNEEAEDACVAMEQRFPGYRADNYGITMDVQQAAETAKKYNFKP